MALGQHRALAAMRERMKPGEHVMAFLDDIYTACRPAHIHVHHGKTRVWNRGGVEPRGMEEITRAKVVKPDAVGWRGDPLLPFSQQGVKVLGIPIGHTGYVREFFERKTKQTRSALPTRSVCERHPSCCPSPHHVWRHEGELL